MFKGCRMFRRIGYGSLPTAPPNLFHRLIRCESVRGKAGMVTPALNLAGAMVLGRELCYVCWGDGGISSER